MNIENALNSEEKLKRPDAAEILCRPKPRPIISSDNFFYKVPSMVETILPSLAALENLFLEHRYWNNSVDFIFASTRVNASDL